MKTWRIPVIWQMTATIKVGADTLEEAVEVAKDPTGVIPVPTDGIYVDDSWAVDGDDMDEFRSFYNGGQEDDIPEPEELVPVVHAYWKPGKTYTSEYWCSNCGELWNDIKTPYCHECGAKMDLKSEGTDE